MIFSPAYLSALLIRPIRFFFENMGPDNLRWDDVPSNSLIEVDTINNFHKVKVQDKPRVLISRGQYSLKPVGLADNLAQGKGFYENKGRRDNVNMFLIDGVAQIMIQARQEGTCERVTDLVQHFIAWTAPMIADAHGFKTTFVPMNVSPCVPDKEDDEIFTCTLNLPWTREEQWRVQSGDDVKLKNFIMTLTKVV